MFLFNPLCLFDKYVSFKCVIELFVVLWFFLLTN